MTWPGPEATPPKVPQLLLLPHAQVQVKLINNHRSHPNPTEGIGRPAVTSCAISGLGLWFCSVLQTNRHLRPRGGAMTYIWQGLQRPRGWCFEGNSGKPRREGIVGAVRALGDLRGNMRCWPLHSLFASGIIFSHVPP